MRSIDPTLERVFRTLTHINIGAAMGMVLWILWSGLQVASGAWEVSPPQRPTLPQMQTHPTAPCPVHGAVDHGVVAPTGRA